MTVTPSSQYAGGAVTTAVAPQARTGRPGTATTRPPAVTSSPSCTSWAARSVGSNPRTGGGTAASGRTSGTGTRMPVPASTSRSQASAGSSTTTRATGTLPVVKSTPRS